MSKPARVLFMSAPIGSGHLRAAAALEKALVELRPDLKTDVVSVFDFFNRFWGQALLKGYLQLLKFFPKSYGMMYGWGNTSKLALAGRTVISSFLAKRMHKYIMDYSPSLIVCTHATPAGLAAYLLNHKELNIPVVAVVTDFVIHRLWIYDKLANYFVASEELCQVLQGYQIANSQALGIPIDGTFERPPDKARLIRELGLLEGTRTILIMGGGAGILPMQDIIAALQSFPETIQVIAVTGNNSALYHKLNKQKENIHYNLQIIGFADNIAELMAVSDVLISKPGGMTAAEAVRMKLPLVIFRPIPGQEEGNSNFLLHRQVAVRAESVSELLEVLRRLLGSDGSLLTTMKENAVRLAKPEAAKKIAARVIEEYLSDD